MVNKNIKADWLLVPVVKCADSIFVRKRVQRIVCCKLRFAILFNIIWAMHIRVRLLERAFPKFNKFSSVS